MPIPLPTETLNTIFYHVFNLIRKFSKCEKNVEKTFLKSALIEGDSTIIEITPQKKFAWGL